MPIDVPSATFYNIVNIFYRQDKSVADNTFARRPDASTEISKRMAAPEVKSSAVTNPSGASGTGAGSSSASNLPSEFPSSISFGNLKTTNAEYDPIDPLTKIGVLQKHRDLYQGGKSFRKNVGHYLVRRAYEGKDAHASNDPRVYPKSTGDSYVDNPLATGSSIGGSGAEQYEARKKRAWYTPLVAGIIDFMVSAVFQNPPTIVAAAPLKDGKKSLIESMRSKISSLVFGIQESDTSEAAYWHDLNRNADGKGRDLAAVLRNALLEVMIDKRGYLMPSFPSSEADTAHQAKEEGAYDATICFLSATDVDDWQCDESGELEWVRVHKKDTVRSSPEVQPDTTRHRWTYTTAQAQYIYEISYPIAEEPKAETLVPCIQTLPHDVGRLPVVPIRIPDGLWVMDRLSDTALSLFNRQSAATWTLDNMAFCLLVISSQKDFSQIVMQDLAGLKLDANESAQFLAPPAGICDAQQKDIERLKEDLFLAIQAMVLVAAAKDEQGRQSGVAKQRDFFTLSALLEAFAAPIRDSIEECVEIIREYRDDKDLVLAVQGLDKFDVMSLESKLKNATDFLNIKDAPASARNWTILDASLAMTANAPAEIREQVVQEVMQGDPQKTSASENNSATKSEKSTESKPSTGNGSNDSSSE